MDWKKYEAEIEAYFREEYPTARIRTNARLPGKLSKTKRQIDLLIDEEIVGFSLRLIIDAKYRNKKLDVKDVEEFSGMVRDVGADKGILICTEGYTDAAIQRAYAEELVLEVLNFKDLQLHHGKMGFVYSGPNGSIVQPPFGWVVDGTQGRGPLACLYERGLTYEEANKAREFMYVNFWTKKEPAKNLEELLRYQETYMREGQNPVSQIETIEGVKRTDGARSTIRIARFLQPRGLAEYTGFVEFDNFIFICVLFSPDELAQKNLSKLRFVMRKVVKLKVKREDPDFIIFDDTP
jgi:Restriction endonuclease